MINFWGKADEKSGVKKREGKAARTKQKQSKKKSRNQITKK
jgi:hypothetical protein